MDLDGHTIEVSNEEKIFFPDEGITKGEIVDYYRRIADLVLPFLADRPLVLRRFPDGITDSGFFQKDTPEHFPDWIETTTLDKEEGGTVTHVVATGAATLAYVANQGAIELHTLLARADNPHQPDQLILDLDPSTDDVSDVIAATGTVREVLEEMGVRGFVKSTGSRGVHVLIRLDAKAGFDDARALARDLAETVAAQQPDRFTTAVSKRARGDRVFVDWLRNSYGQHAVAPFSVRALPGAPVAVPLDWDEATNQSFDPRRYTMRNVFRRLASKQDPWAGMARHTYSVSGLRSRLDSLASTKGPGRSSD